MNQYVEREIHYTDDGRLMDGSYAIMMDWEKPVMEFQAEQICRNGGNILNVGFGMGFIDDAIERYDIKGHTIIELHPGVQDEILKRGWAKKEHVKLLFGDWRKFFPYLPKFDGVYIDTWDELIIDFASNVEDILNHGGVFSFFNNPKDDLDRDHIQDDVFYKLKDKFNIRVESMKIPHVDAAIRQTGHEDISYWKPENSIYHSPIFTLK